MFADGADNNLGAYCTNFPRNGTLCIQDTCSTYTVRANNTCTSIASAFNISVAQILSCECSTPSRQSNTDHSQGNPILNPTCSNLNVSMGDEICIGKPGTPYVTPTISIAAATSFVTAAPRPTDVANGTNQDCGLYYQAVLGDYCNLICVKFGISLSDFVFLNPSINSKYAQTLHKKVLADECQLYKPIRPGKLLCAPRGKQ